MVRTDANKAYQENRKRLSKHYNNLLCMVKGQKYVAEGKVSLPKITTAHCIYEALILY